MDRRNGNILHILAKNGLTLTTFAEKHGFQLNTVHFALRRARVNPKPFGLKTVEILETLKQYERKAAKR